MNSVKAVKYRTAPIFANRKTKRLIKHFLSLLLIFLSLLNSFSAIISFNGLKAGMELSVPFGAENEQQEEKTDPEVKEVFPYYTVTVNSFLTELNTVKKKKISTHSLFAEEVNLSNPTPPPEQA